MSLDPLEMFCLFLTDLADQAWHCNYYLSHKTHNRLRKGEFFHYNNPYLMKITFSEKRNLI